MSQHECSAETWLERIDRVLAEYEFDSPETTGAIHPPLLEPVGESKCAGAAEREDGSPLRRECDALLAQCDEMSATVREGSKLLAEAREGLSKKLREMSVTHECAVSGGAGVIKTLVDSAGEGRVIESGVDAHDAGQKCSAVQVDGAESDGGVLPDSFASPRTTSAPSKKFYYTKFCAVCGRHSKGAFRRMVNRRTLTPRFCGTVCAEKFKRAVEVPPQDDGAAGGGARLDSVVTPSTAPQSQVLEAERSYHCTAHRLTQEAAERWPEEIEDER